MSESNPDQQSSSRWWEFYAVRYGMGSVVGAVIFFFLCNADPLLKQMLFLPKDKDLNGTLLTLYAAYGLTYCYIASAPILVFHVGRFLYKDSENSNSGISRCLHYLMPVVATGVFYWLALRNSIGFWDSVFYSAIFIIGFSVLQMQYLSVFKALTQSQELWGFYENLASHRKNSSGGIVDSYKHMREHGNSFFIVVLEIILALVLYIAGKLHLAFSVEGTNAVAIYVLVIFLWILPAAVVWQVGTFMERHFSQSKQGQKIDSMAPVIYKSNFFGLVDSFIQWHSNRKK